MDQHQIISDALITAPDWLLLMVLGLGLAHGYWLSGRVQKLQQLENSSRCRCQCSDCLRDSVEGRPYTTHPEGHCFQTKPGLGVFQVGTKDDQVVWFIRRVDDLPTPPVAKSSEHVGS